MDQTTDRDVKKELELMNSMYDNLKDLPAASQEAVLSYVANALGIDHPAIRLPKSKKALQENEAGKDVDNAGRNSTYQTFAEFYDAAGPETGSEKALVGGYWMQVCQGATDFVSMQVNDELKHVGANIANITVAFNGLINSNPRLVLQVMKSGKAQQGRKRYRLTVAGIKAVKRMINGEEQGE